MLLERAELQIRESMELEFAAAMKSKGLELLASVPGVKSVQLGRGVENPQKFMLLVEWDAMDSHTAFKTSPIMTEFRALLKPFSTGGAMEHFNMN
ncbi:antibiotic biosynthesis monooxygenase family protein [Steroidobacter flavus]|uniref:Antibiotic biosynthesis monooxygenase family protein n=1 Tax=Steroidobacter flavus TaxID=1842136 RepID=A0ABV8T543_9GAMM